MVAQIATSPAQSSARLGRSAWVVLLAGLFAFAFVTGATLVAGGLNSRRAGVELLPAYGVAVGVLIASYGWSLMLAARALKRGENSRLPIRLINFSLFPLAAYAIAHWFPLPLHPLLNCPWFTAAYFPVLIPFLALAIPTGTILVPKIVRRIEERRARKSLPAWTPTRRRVMSALVMYAWIWLLGSVLVPMPLFVYGLAFRRHEFLSEAIFKHTPDIYRDAAEWVMQPIDVRRFRNGRMYQLSHGYASTGRLHQRVTDGDAKISGAALTGLRARDPQSAVALAAGFIANSVSGPSSGPSDDTLQFTIGRYGTPQQRKELFDFAAKNPAWVLRQPFFDGLALTLPDPELIPFLEAHVRSNSASRHCALKPLAHWLWEGEAEALLKKMVDSTDVAARDYVLERNWFSAYAFQSQERVAARVFIYSVEYKDIAVRKKAWSEFWLTNPSQAEHTYCVRELLRIMSSPDIVQRRGAAQCLAAKLSLYELMSLQSVATAFRKIHDPFTPLYPNRLVEAGGPPELESPEETEALESIRAAAEKWLKEHSQ